MYTGVFVLAASTFKLLDTSTIPPPLHQIAFESCLILDRVISEYGGMAGVLASCTFGTQMSLLGHAPTQKKPWVLPKPARGNLSLAPAILCPKVRNC